MVVERSIQKNGLINLLALLAGTVATFALARTGHALAGHLAAAFMGIGTLVALVSWFQMRLEEREKVEKLEFDELARTKGGSSLFAGQEAGGFPAQQAREQFEKWFVPAFTIVILILQAGGAWRAWQWLGQPGAILDLRQPMVTMALFGLFGLILFLLGKFSSTIARLEHHRLLRAGPSYLLICAYLSAIAAGAVAAVQSGVPRADLIAARVLVVLLGVSAVETALNLILEMYRPRVKGRLAQPVYESRLIGLLAHPEDVFKTAAHTFDYQFGFKVSDTWIFKFFERALGWLILLQFIVLLLSTCLVFIEPGERGLLERWGKPVQGRTELAPGLHFKFPYPVDQVRRFWTEQVQVFTIGSQPDPEKAKLPVVLWNLAHSKEDLLLVANRDQVSVDSANKEVGKRTPPVSLLTVSFPVHYTITDLPAFAYNYEDSGSLLQDIATREVIRYLASSDITDVMARSRQNAAADLQARIQDAVARAEPKLGVTVNYIGLQDIHPPVAVAPDFQKVVGASQEKLAKILAAQAAAIRTNALAGARAFTLVAEAEAERQRAEVNVGARAALFTNQLPAYAAAPSVYVQRAYLQTFAKATAPARKYVITTTNTYDVIQFDLQDKLRADLLDVTVPEKK
jgi:regulator of protease activity HflC (stomatin/prohibitin superfamily)